MFGSTIEFARWLLPKVNIGFPFSCHLQIQCSSQTDHELWCLQDSEENLDSEAASHPCYERVNGLFKFLMKTMIYKLL